MQRLLLPICVLGLCAGCEAESESESDVDSAAHGWRAASAAMAQVGGDLAVAEDGDDPFSVTAACPEGGTAQIDGDADATTFSATIRFADCGAESVRIDGEMSVSGTGSAEGIDVEYVGQLDFEGAVQMRCIVDMTASTSTRIEGMNVSADARVSGSICGVEADLAVGFDS